MCVVISVAPKQFINILRKCTCGAGGGRECMVANDGGPWGIRGGGRASDGDAGLCCGFRLRPGEVFAYLRRIHNLKDQTECRDESTRWTTKVSLPQISIRSIGF